MAINVFRHYANSVEANIALSKLQANEIPCFLTNEHTNDLLWHMNIGLGGIKLMLYERDFERATAILSEGSIQITNERHGNVICPHCGSNNVKFGPRTKKKLGLLGFIVSLFIGAPAPVVHKSFHCFNCESDFEYADEKKEN